MRSTFLDSLSSLRLHLRDFLNGLSLWLASGLVILALVVPTLVSSVLARGHLAKVEGNLGRTKAHLKQLDLSAAEEEMRNLKISLGRAEKLMESPINSGGLILPVASENLLAARALIDASKEALSGATLATKVLDRFPQQDGKLVVPWNEGGVDLAPFRNLTSDSERLKNHIESAYAEASQSPDELLVPRLSRARTELISELHAARSQARRAAGASFLIPRLLGRNGTRKWIVGAENNAELRGRGGYLGSFGVLEAANGRMTLGSFMPVAELPPLPVDLLDDPNVPQEFEQNYEEIAGLDAWPNLFMTPHFPSAASLFTRELDRNVGIPATGVVSIDPVGLSYLMEVTGPVTVEGFPEPLTSANVVEWSLSRLYVDSPTQDVRREQSSKIAEAVWQRLTSSNSLDSRKLSEAFGRALQERRMVVWSKDKSEQKVIEDLGIGGTVTKSVRGDYLMLISQNFGENKLDYYLQRSINLSGRVRSDGSLEAETKVTVRNTAPSDQPLPGYVAGERPRLGLAPGVARSFMTLFVPKGAVLTEVVKDGKPTNVFDNALELGKRRFAIYTEVGPQGTQEFRFRYTVPDVLVGDAYRLTVQSQSTVRPDTLTVDIDLPAGARRAASDSGRIQWSKQINSDKTLEVKLRQSLALRFLRAVSIDDPSRVWGLFFAGMVLIMLGLLSKKFLTAAHEERLTAPSRVHSLRQ